NLLNELYSSNPENQENKTPNFGQFAKKWNTYVNGETIFYKTFKQLEKYHGHWNEKDFAKKTCQQIPSSYILPSNTSQQQLSPFIIPSNYVNINRNTHRQAKQKVIAPRPYHPYARPADMITQPIQYFNMIDIPPISTAFIKKCVVMLCLIVKVK
ncbi:unnamed protein product, partial [Rhizopus stolonifer]